jgi:DNA mismatch endonuclease (patch repair protein)
MMARRDTKPELALRQALHARGYRYRVNYPVPGQRRRTIDIAFTRARIAVFVDGCFWHSCPDHGTRPRSNASWWFTKLAVNRARDEQVNSQLKELGWCVVRIWEHDNVEVAVRKVARAMAEPPVFGSPTK